jgi:hypothetical protein
VIIPLNILLDRERVGLTRLNIALVIGQFDTCTQEKETHTNIGNKKLYGLQQLDIGLHQMACCQHLNSGRRQVVSKCP